MFESEETRLVDVPVMTSALVANSTLPATVVDAAGTSCWTNAVVAKAVVLLPGDCVTAVVPVGKEGVPEKVGLARGAAPETSATASVIAPVRPATEVTGAEVRYPWPLTKAVVAMEVSLSPRAGVTARASPVKIGEASGA
jgi:hypothetical protein